MIAYFATFNGRVLAHEFGSSNLDRRATQMFVNRNNGAVARRSGNDSKPYAVLTVEFEPRPTATRKVYVVVTEHTTGVQTQVFADADDAVEYAASISPDTDGSMLPNLSSEAFAPYGGARSDAYYQGFYWLKVNRYAAIFTERVTAAEAPKDMDFEEVGREAARNDESASPALNEKVVAALDGVEVGGVAVAIMQAFRRGYEAERTAQADEAMHDMPASDTDGPFYDEETTVATPKKLGEMTPAERAAAVKSAAQRFQAELEANAPAIAEILEEERVATPADIVKRLQDSQYPLTAITALGWGMGPAQLGITDAVIEAERQGLVVTSMHNGKQMVTLALQDDEVPARPVPAPLALLRAYNAAHAHEAIVAIEEPTEAEVARCRDNGQHLLSSRHRAVECPIAAELAKAEVLAGADDEMELVDPRITDAAVEARCIATWNRFPEWDPATQASYRRTARFTLLAKLAAQPVDEMEPVDQTAAAARAAVAYTEGLEEGLRRSAEHLDAYLGKLKGVSLMQKSDLKRLADEIRAGLKDADATRSPLWYGGNR